MTSRLNSVTKSSSHSLRYHRSMYSQKHNSSQFRHLREKIKIHNNHYLSRRQHEDKINTHFRKNYHPEFNSLRTKSRKILHDPIPPSEKMRIDLDYQDLKNGTEFLTNTSKTTMAQPKHKENNSPTLSTMAVTDSLPNINNSTILEPQSRSQTSIETFSPLAFISKSVKSVCNSAISSHPLHANSDENNSLILTMSPLPSLLQTLSCHSGAETIIKDVIKQSSEWITISLSDNKVDKQNHDLCLEKVVYFENKVVLANNDVVELKKILEELKVYCQKVLSDNTRQPYTEDNFQNNNVVSLIKNNYFAEPWAFHIQNHLSQPLKKILLTIKDMEHQLNSLKTGQTILNNYGSQLPEAILLEILRHHNILKNNDAQYTQDNIGPWVNKEFKGTVMQPYGEGFTLHDRVYEYMVMHSSKYFTIYRQIPLTIQEIEQIKIKLNKGDFFVKSANLDPHIIREHYSGILMGSGDIIHNMIGVTITDKFGKQFDIGINSFTSSKGQGTISLGCNQIVNEDPKQQNKQQRCRPFKQAIYIPENKYITKDSRFTEFATSTNYYNSGINLREKIYQEFDKKKLSLGTMPIRMIQEITQPLLYDIAKDLIAEDFKQVQKEYNKLQNDLKNSSSTQQKLMLQKRENIWKNLRKEKDDAAFIKTLPKTLQDIFKMKNKIDAEIKKITDKK